MATATKTFTIVYHKTSSSSVTDLTGTKWTINSHTCEAGYGQFNVNYHYNDKTRLGNTMYVGYTYEPYSLDGDPDDPFIPTANNVFLMPFMYFLMVNDIIEFTGGSDVTNPDLIAWLESHATLQVTKPAFAAFNGAILKKINGMNIKSINGVGVRSGKSSSVSLITFRIQSTTYEAEEGMTWAEWCDSEYNTGGLFYVLDNKVTNGVQYVNEVVPTNTIINEYRYTLGGGSND